jgi:hypothetical protein
MGFEPMHQELPDLLPFQGNLLSHLSTSLWTGTLPVKSPLAFTCAISSALRSSSGLFFNILFYHSSRRASILSRTVPDTLSSSK